MAIDLCSIKNIKEFKKLKEFYQNSNNDFENFSHRYLDCVKSLIETIENNDKFDLKELTSLIKQCDISIIMDKHRKNDSFPLVVTELSKLLPQRPVSQNYDLQRILKINLNHNIQIRQNLTMVEFMKEYFDKNLPVLMYNGKFPSSHSLGFVELLKNHYMRLFPVEIGHKYTDLDWRQEIMTFEEFFERFMNQNSTEKGYIAQFNVFQLIPSLISKFNIPDYALIGNEDVDINFWIGPHDTISPTHFDKKDNILTQLVGAKCVLLFDPKVHEFVIKSGFTNTTDVDGKKLYNDAPDKSISVMLVPGNSLFIPKGWWHYCYAMTDSISISCWF